MLCFPVVGLLLVSFAPTVLSQEPLETAQQTLIGTWSSGSKNVVTGSGFANPINMTFIYPATTGISYSFDEKNYEIARYRFNSNGSEPTCITGVIGWSHGTYSLNTNGSMSMTPRPDGFQQVQDPCAAVSNFIEDYRVTSELYQQWLIFDDPQQGPKLHMFQFDGSPLAPMFKVSDQPIMLPTQLLRNVSSVNASSDSGAGVQRRSESEAAGQKLPVMVITTAGMAIVVIASLLL